MKISLCMIVKDEEKFIDKCLSHVLSVVDEAIIVDTGSTDGTLSILDGYGGRITVRHYRWHDDFSAARNESLRGATGDWIMILDADEMLTCDRDKLRDFLTTAERDAYIVTFIEAMEKKKDIVRLFRTGVKYKGKLHEQLDGIKTIGYLDESLAFIEHYGYAPEVIEAKGKRERNLRILQTMLRETPNDPLLLTFLGSEYTAAGKYEEGLELLLQVLPKLRPHPLAKHHACNKIVMNYYLLGRFDECRRFLEILGQQGYTSPFFTYTLGDCYAKLGQYKEALSTFSKCLGSSGQTMDDNGFDSFLPKLKIAVIMAALGKPAAAVRWYIEAVLDKKNKKRIGKDEAWAYIKENAPVEIALQFKKSIAAMYN